MPGKHLQFPLTVGPLTAVPTDSCLHWQLSPLTVVSTDSCPHWQLSDLTVVRSYRCSIWQLISDSCLLTVKTQGFIGSLSALDRGYPKCVVLATCFGLSRTVKPYKSLLEKSMYTSILTFTNEHWLTEWLTKAVIGLGSYKNDRLVLQFGSLQ